MRKPEPLSNLPHEALRQAVLDLRAVEQDPLYSVNMAKWHERIVRHAALGANSTEPQCQVCLAGAVMAKRMRAYVACNVLPCDFDDDVCRRLEALDSARRGDWAEFLDGFGVDCLRLESELLERVSVPTYADSPEGFKDALLRAADVIERASVGGARG